MWFGKSTTDIDILGDDLLPEANRLTKDWRSSARTAWESAAGPANRKTESGRLDKWVWLNDLLLHLQPLDWKSGIRNYDPVVIPLHRRRGFDILRELFDVTHHVWLCADNNSIR